ncbi:MAG TPA: thiamine phosphate synthase [Terriglobales bacterium]|nr:thiamine phosphate synthase [Terriglobales bacterium]
MLLYYITDRKQFPGDEAARRQALLGKIGEAARCGVDFIQLREKDLSVRELQKLADEAVAVVRRAQTATRLLINSRVDLAIAAKADGVQLRSKDISPKEARKIYKGGELPDPVVGVSCHTLDDVDQAEVDGASFVVFSPVFEKPGMPEIFPVGLKELSQAATRKIPVLALGGVTFENALECLHADVAGIAGIRLFQDHDICDTVRELRNVS